MSLLLEASSQGEAVDDGGEEGAHVEEGGDAVQLGELLVERHHVLGVRGSVVALLAVFLFCMDGCVSGSPTPVYSALQNR